jgi:hypothetical protein
MTVRNELGVEIPIGNISTGFLFSDKDFDDYGIKAGKPYRVRYSDDGTGAYIFADGTVRLWNNEIRPDVWAHLTWKLTK